MQRLAGLVLSSLLLLRSGGLAQSTFAITARPFRTKLLKLNYDPLPKDVRAFDRNVCNVTEALWFGGAPFFNRIANEPGPCQSNDLNRYSSRLAWSLRPNRLSELLEAQRQSGAALLDLTISNPTEAFEAYPHGRIAEAYAAIDDFSYRPDPFGQEQARISIAGWYRQRDIGVSADHLALTASTSEAYSLLFKLLCDPGDEIVVPVPSYPLFEYLARLESVRTVPYQLAYDGSWFFDFASLRAAITNRTRAIVIVNPNNPTGSYLKIHELETLFDIARFDIAGFDSAGAGLPIISDEVFMDFSFAGGSGLVSTLIGHDSVTSFSLNGLSKAAGMPQMKLGWIAVNGPSNVREAIRPRMELLLDTYLSVGAPVQAALPALLEIGGTFQLQIAARIARNRSALAAALRGSPVHVLRGEGGWSAILQMPNVLTEELWAERLLTLYQVIVQPGYFFDMSSEAYVVISLIAEEAAFAEGIRRLRELASAVTC